VVLYLCREKGCRKKATVLFYGLWKEGHPLCAKHTKQLKERTAKDGIHEAFLRLKPITEK
jgi:hypothetical protein